MWKIYNKLLNSNKIKILSTESKNHGNYPYDTLIACGQK